MSLKRIFRKKDILTIPNLLSLVRLALIPLIVWLYCGLEDYYAAIGAILLSGLTDIADGFIARHWNMVSDFGKILDPIADKLTQAALLICLLFKYPLMWAVIVIFTLREITMVVMGMIVIRKSDEINSAKWYGKVNTVVLYTVMMLLILFPNIPPLLANGLILLTGVMILVSLVLYARFYHHFLRDRKKQSKSDSEK